jgi:DNA mismatch endonuclease (patch repair protein)
MANKVRFTEGRVQSLACPPGRKYDIHLDTQTPGLGVRVTESGARSYVFEKRSMRITVGDVDSWPLTASTRRSMTLTERRTKMSSIRKKNTKPELIVRSIIWKLGGRYRIHVNTLPGCPDIVMKSRRLLVFVHGCLWHMHEGCKLARVPKSRPDYWPIKLARNKARDAEHIANLRDEGWRVEVIWECETRDLVKLEQRLSQILSASRETMA